MNMNILKINNDNDNNNNNTNDYKNYKNYKTQQQHNIVDIEKSQDVIKPYINQIIYRITIISDKLKYFYNELIYLIYVDLHKSYLFIVSNKTYFIYAFILSILLQFTNINTLSSSYSKKYKKQYGGGDADPNKPQPDPPIDPNKPQPDPPIDPNKPPIDPNKPQPDPAPDPNKPQIDPNKPLISPFKPLTSQSSMSSKNIKENRMHLSYFEQIKAKFGKNTKLGGKYGALGPVFSNMDKIFGSVKYIFSLIAVVLAVVGVLSLPVLILLIITYTVIKKMVNRFIIL